MEQNTQQDLALVSEHDLSLVDINALSGKQLKQLLKKTPKQYVHTRPAKGGGEWEYVTGGYVKKVLNLMFGWQWSFEIIDEKVLHGEVIVKGKLTCTSNGIAIVKMQYGNKDIAFLTETRNDDKGQIITEYNSYKKQQVPKKFKTDIPLSIGNDMKAAATDCLKKCAAELGIAADIYNKLDFKEVNVEIEDKPTSFKPQPKNNGTE